MSLSENLGSRSSDGTVKSEVDEKAITVAVSNSASGESKLTSIPKHRYAKHYICILIQIL